MELTAKQKRYLRTLSHNRKPLVIIGANGLTDSVMEEISTTIDHHELIKVRINADDKASREKMIQKICTDLNSQLVFVIGHVATFYKANKKLRSSAKQKINLPRI